MAEADDASRFQILDFEYGLWGYKCLYAPFIRLLGGHYPGHDYKQLRSFVLQAHPVAFSDRVIQGSRDASGWRHRALH